MEYQGDYDDEWKDTIQKVFTTSSGVKITGIGSMPINIGLPNDIWSIILDLLLRNDDGISYALFRRCESVSKAFYSHMNSKKVYITFPRDRDVIIPIITTDKSAKRNNSCCSIYLHLHSNLKKRGNMSFFRMEYHNFPPDLPKVIAEKYKHDISKLTFNSCPVNLHSKSARLYTKYPLTREDLVGLKSRLGILSDYTEKTLTHVKTCRKLTHLHCTYMMRDTNSKFFFTFEAPKKRGKIVKSRYPNHYVIFNDLYQDKLGPEQHDNEKKPCTGNGDDSDSEAITDSESDDETANITPKSQLEWYPSWDADDSIDSDLDDYSDDDPNSHT